MFCPLRANKSTSIRQIFGLQSPAVVGLMWSKNSHTGNVKMMTPQAENRAAGNFENFCRASKIISLVTKNAPKLSMRTAKILTNYIPHDSFLPLKIKSSSIKARTSLGCSTSKLTKRSGKITTRWQVKKL